MARRAQQGSVARCPYCEAFLPQVAPECPQCRFPLTMDAADGGFSTSEQSGTTSTATPGGRSARPVVASGLGVGRPSPHGTRVQRMRITAWLLGVMSILLLLAGLGVVFTASSPDARSDRVAQTSLLTALNAVREPLPTGITILDSVERSDAPEKVSVDSADDLWFGAARSGSGSCFLLAVRFSDGARGGGTLDKEDPCTGAQARLRSEKKLSKPAR